MLPADDKATHTTALNFSAKPAVNAGHSRAVESDVQSLFVFFVAM